MMVTEAQVYGVLNEMIHPSFGMSLKVLEMVRAVRVLQSRIEIDLVMNCPGCPTGQAVLDNVRRALHALDQETIVRLNVLPEVWHPPWGEWQ
jgi:metal-sulfur cluster biosynthetic enzyme